MALNNNTNKYMVGGQFNVTSFNLDFSEVIEEQNVIAEDIENKKIKQINDYYINEKKYNYNVKNDLIDITLSDHLTNWLNMFKDIIYDIIHYNTDDDFMYIFYKNNRQFYIGLTILFVVSIMYFLYNYIFVDN
jgi:hypothetical protein